ncbi:MAG TPA: ribosome-associated translation inhibitor RaiA [Pseudomonadales bacterium]
MQLSITGHHIDVTDSLRAYVTNKFVRLERHYERMTNVHVVLSVEKLIQKAEATIHTSGAELYADATSEDLYAAIDALVDKLDRQIVKHKEKTRSHGQRESRH